jgi:hypothetical protein
MEPIQDQISILAHKVESIYQILERLDQEVFQLLRKQSHGEEGITFHYLFNGHNSNHNGTKNGHGNGNGNGNSHGHERDEWILSQHDILIDSTGMEITHHQLKEQDLSPQVQIQRLTAQLTAAYNRIAALEEQLLSKRWH